MEMLNTNWKRVFYSFTVISRRLSRGTNATCFMKTHQFCTVLRIQQLQTLKHRFFVLPAENPEIQDVQRNAGRTSGFRV